MIRFITSLIAIAVLIVNVNASSLHGKVLLNVDASSPGSDWADDSIPIPGIFRDNVRRVFWLPRQLFSSKIVQGSSKPLSKVEYFMDGIVYYGSDKSDSTNASIMWNLYPFTDGRILEFQLTFPSCLKDTMLVSWGGEIFYDSTSSFRNWTITNPGISRQIPLSVYWSIGLTGMYASFSWNQETVSIHNESFGLKDANYYFFINGNFASTIGFQNFISNVILDNIEECYFGVQSMKIIEYSSTGPVCVEGVTCSEHGKFMNFSNYPVCVCDSGYSGPKCDLYVGIRIKRVELFMAQSGDTDSEQDLEHIYDMANANAAYASNFSDDACNDNGSENFVVAKYTIELDANFRDYQGFNNGEWMLVMDIFPFLLPVNASLVIQLGQTIVAGKS
jgi:hypothetical protein